MADYTLEGPKWGNPTYDTPGGTITWALDTTISPVLDTDIAQAFADWAKNANIAFQQVSNPASAQITIGEGGIDGLNGTLGITDYQYSSSNSLTGAQINFDSGEDWHNNGTEIVSDGGVNFFLVALHEIGHSIGLGHYNVAPAIMNAVIDNDLTDLTQSDIDGARALYGAAPMPPVTSAPSASSHFGAFAFNTQSAGGEVYALYDAAFARAPDPLGLEAFAQALGAGGSIQGLAQTLLASPEGQSHLGATDNKTFVDELYQTALGRPADPSGEQSWTAQLNNGLSRAGALVDFAFSAENQSEMSGAFKAGVFVPSQNAAEVARLYYGVLGRAPDAGGLDAHTSAVNAGQSISGLAQDMIGSAEFATRGLAGNTQFVEALYQGALGRAADPGGLQTYQNALANGISRADVAVTIAESFEAQQHLLGNIETGWKLA